jgi:hypothetical protein
MYTHMRKRQIPLFNPLMHALILAGAYILQTLVFPYLSPTGVRPALLPLAAAGAAVFGGCTRGGAFGLMAGILCDMSFNQPVAVMTLILTLFGMTAGFMSDTVMARSFPSYIVCALAVQLITVFAQMFALLFFEGAPVYALVSVAVRQIAYSMIFAIPMYFAVRRLGDSRSVER